jgi:hypothetical protein
LARKSVSFALMTVPWPGAMLRAICIFWRRDEQDCPGTRLTVTVGRERTKWHTQDAEKGPKLAALKAIENSWERPDYVAKQGWATMPGDTAPDKDVASACSNLLIGG